MGLRLSSSSQNPFSFFKSHKEPGYLHIWLQFNIIFYYLASSFIWSASHPTTHPSNPIIPSTCRLIHPFIHPSFIPSSSYTHIYPHLSIFSFRHPYLSPSSHPPTIYTPSIHPAISTLQFIHSSTYPTSIPINPPSTHSPTDYPVSHQFSSVQFSRPVVSNSL